MLRKHPLSMPLILFQNASTARSFHLIKQCSHHVTSLQRTAFVFLHHTMLPPYLPYFLPVYHTLSLSTILFTCLPYSLPVYHTYFAESRPCIPGLGQLPFTDGPPHLCLSYIKALQPLLLQCSGANMLRTWPSTDPASTKRNLSPSCMPAVSCCVSK